MKLKNALLHSTSFIRCNLTLEAPKIPEIPAVSQSYSQVKYLNILKFNKLEEARLFKIDVYIWKYKPQNHMKTLCLTKGKCPIISVQVLMHTCHSKLFHISLHLTVFIGNLTLTLKSDHSSSWITLIRREISS